MSDRADVCRIVICKDPSEILVTKLNVTSIRAKSQEEEEGLLRVSGSVQIKDNGRAAFQLDETNISYVCERKTYSNGNYKTGFAVNKTELRFATILGIITETLLGWPLSCYGWTTDGTCFHGGSNHFESVSTQNDLQGNTAFTIELLLDCENRKIQYFNEQTQSRRKLRINLQICPFPWQLFIDLQTHGDCIQLL